MGDSLCFSYADDRNNVWRVRGTSVIHVDCRHCRRLLRKSIFYKKNRQKKIAQLIFPPSFLRSIRHLWSPQQISAFPPSASSANLKKPWNPSGKARPPKRICKKPPPEFARSISC